MTTKIALITGANKGIGYETARQLGSQDMTVLVGARDADRGREAEQSLRDGGADAHFVQLDVTDAKSIQRAAEWIEATCGRLDVLVNNAGTATVARQGYPPSQTSLQDMRAVYEINVFGVVAVTNAMLPLLRRAPAARIVNVSSEVGSITGESDPAHPLAQMPASVQYPSSKAALNMITVMYAKELRDTPIKVNAANPGSPPRTSITTADSAPLAKAPSQACTSRPCRTTARAASTGATSGPPTAPAATASSPGKYSAGRERSCLIRPEN